MTRRQIHSAGFALAELLLCTAIFAILTGLCFYVAITGFQLFNQSTARQTLQRDTRAIFSWLQRDVGLSNLVRCVVSTHQTGDVSKDTLALAGLSNWQQPIATDPLGLPAWNTVVVYQATPQGELHRYSFDAASAGLTVPLEKTDIANGLRQAEGGGLQYRDRRHLTNNVRSFSVSLNEARNTAVFNLILETTTRGVGAGKPRQEVLQLRTTISPRNTWPRL